jgi:hypothetical protein
LTRQIQKTSIATIVHIGIGIMARMVVIRASVNVLVLPASILTSNETIGIAASNLLGSEEVDILKGKVK